MRCKAHEKFEPQQPVGCEDSNYRSATQQVASYTIRLKAMQALCPPNPSESEIAIVSGVSTAVFGV